MLVVGHVLRPADDLAFVGDIGNFHGFHGHFLHELGLHELLGVFLVVLMVFVVFAFMVGHMLRPANDLAFVGDIRNFHGLYGHFLYEFGLDVLFGSLFGFGFGDLLFFAHGFSVLSYHYGRDETCAEPVRCRRSLGNNTHIARRKNRVNLFFVKKSYGRYAKSTVSARYLSG